MDQPEYEELLSALLAALLRRYVRHRVRMPKAEHFHVKITPQELAESEGLQLVVSMDAEGNVYARLEEVTPEE